MFHPVVHRPVGLFYSIRLLPHRLRRVRIDGDVVPILRHGSLRFGDCERAAARRSPTSSSGFAGRFSYECGREGVMRRVVSSFVISFTIRGA
jgi:hypothetical protein